MRGHNNVKNFVGLASQGSLLACGSETNEVFFYHKAMGAPLFRHRLSEPLAGATPNFVSAIAACNNTDEFIAANSAGHLQVLRLKR